MTGLVNTCGKGDLKQDEVDPDAADQNGWTSLHYAATYGHEAVTRRRLAAGANPNAATQDGWTPLHYAASYGHEVIVPLLLAAGANPDVADQGGWTPLHSAVYHGREAIVQFLLTAGANPTLKRRCKTPFQLANTPKLRALLTDAEYVWDHNWTPEGHVHWPEDQRLARVCALALWRSQNDNHDLPFFPPELQHLVFSWL